MSKRKNEYDIQFSSSAAREFRSLPIDVKRQLSPLIEDLRYNPRKEGVIKLRGFKQTYRIRKGKYRIIYEIYGQRKLILVTFVGHRRYAY